MTNTERLAAALSDRYRIERELGEGGMATVYLAEDLKHQRQVAIKVLRPELAAVIGAERFLAEIKTTAHLQHPHILPLHDSGEVAGTVFYVMPYVEGESLRERLTRLKQLPVEETVRIGREVADALEHAHTQGVIHRDIKPENILLQGGHALVADFGIALAVTRSEGAERMTETGMSLGTPHYMSPEQAMGEREIRPAADVYALGCVLYEMLTGEPPFTGATAQAIVAKLLTTDPEPVTTLRRTVPANVDAALEKALQRLPADRFESAGAFADALADPRFGEAGHGPIAARSGKATPGVPPRRFHAVLAVCAALVVVAALGWLRPQPGVPTSAQRVVLWRHPLGRLLDPGQPYEATQAAIAPDGSSIVFVDSTGGTFRLMRKLRGQAVAKPLAGTDGALSPFFSPDGRWIGYVTTDLKLKKISVDGGGSVPLADVKSTELGTSAVWLDDDSLVFLGSAGLSEVGASGGPVRVLLPDKENLSVITMWPLPKSRGVLYTGCSGNCSSESSIHVLDLRSGRDSVIVPNAAGAWYAPTGYLLYTAHDGGLYAMRFDVDRLEATSGPIPVIPDVIAGTFTISASGAVLYTTATGAGASSELMWVARDGSAVPLDSTWKANFQYPALSPDGESLAVSVVGATTQLWIRRSDGTRQQLTQDGAVSWRPAWTRDGRSVVFSSNRSGGAPATAYDLYEQPVDGSAAAKLLLDDSIHSVWEGERSSDGRWLVFREDLPDGSQIQARRVDGDRVSASVPAASASSGAAIALSPDGRWLAYYNNNGGSSGGDIEVVPFPALTPKVVVSHGGGTEPRWASDGRTLFYRSGERFMAVPVIPGPTLQFGPARELFSASGYRAARNRQEYDVAPDGRHFVMIRNLPDTSNTVVYVENWLPELLAKVKGKGGS
jgi:Tol biopolymer transport system component